MLMPQALLGPVQAVIAVVYRAWIRTGEGIEGPQHNTDLATRVHFVVRYAPVHAFVSSHYHL